jgi:hypothetical protein
MFMFQKEGNASVVHLMLVLFIIVVGVPVNKEYPSRLSIFSHSIVRLLSLTTVTGVPDHDGRELALFRLQEIVVFVFEPKSLRFLEDFRPRLSPLCKASCHGGPGCSLVAL